jgi:hypothetical protein
VTELETLDTSNTEIDKVTHLEKKAGMTIAYSGCSLAVKRKALDGAVEIVQLLGKIESSNEYFIPSTALVWQSSKTFRSDPLQEIHIGYIGDVLMNTRTKLSHTSLPERYG